MAAALSSLMSSLRPAPTEMPLREATRADPRATGDWGAALDTVLDCTGDGGSDDSDDELPSLLVVVTAADLCAEVYAFA